jgi:hypothetical protein
VSLRNEGDDHGGKVYGAIAMANTISCVSEAIDPLSIFIGFPLRDLMSQAVRFLLFGEGGTGLKVCTILLRYGEGAPEEGRTTAQLPKERMGRLTSSRRPPGDPGRR